MLTLNSKFLLFSCFKKSEDWHGTDGRTDGRTGTMLNAATYGEPHNNSTIVLLKKHFDLI